jgi:hypothetical protein
MRQLAVQLLQAGQTKHKSVEQSEEDAGGGNLWSMARIRHAGGVLAESEAFVQPGREGR